MSMGCDGGVCHFINVENLNPRASPVYARGWLLCCCRRRYTVVVVDQKEAGRILFSVYADNLDGYVM